jgi:hypothetical protein
VSTGHTEGGALCGQSISSLPTVGILAREVRAIMNQADALGMKRPTQERAAEIARRNLESQT